MKKILAMVLALCLLAPCAFAQEIDLSGMSLAELTELRQRVQLAMFETDEWQEVTVPQGVWKVGKDIPAGTWTVKCLPGTKDRIALTWGNALDESGQKISIDGHSNYNYAYIYCETSRSYNYGDRLEYTFTCKEGDYIIIQDTAAVFTPYHGKPDLGFK